MSETVRPENASHSLLAEWDWAGSAAFGPDACGEPLTAVQKERKMMSTVESEVNPIFREGLALPV